MSVCCCHQHIQTYETMSATSRHCWQCVRAGWHVNNVSYHRDTARCRNAHSRSLEVISCCANRRGIYDFLLALNSNFTSIFNRSWDIKPTLYLSIPYLFSRWNWKKTVGSRWTRFGVTVPRTLDCQTINLNTRKSKPYDHKERPSQTDRQTDEHHGNSATIRSNERKAG